MPLADRVQVSRRFQRAVRIDTDFGDPGTLEGYVCPRSSTSILENMAHQVSESGQGAFTWTGPYGSGKSSLAVAFGAVLGGKIQPESVFGPETSSILKQAFPPRPVLPVVGRRERPATVIGETLSNLTTGRKRRTWTEKQVLDAIGDISARGPGLLVLIDEMGKFLEAAARDESDIHLFQQLAEIASRSGGRLILVGILHQAFEEYAHRLSREMRGEWSKIQGRFMDLAVNAGGDEQIDLLGRAIESNRAAVPPGALAEGVARLSRKSTSPHLAKTLEGCWPLHPIAACLLGPISRRRFGQNQRSIFGFLNSAEPEGFQDFLLNAGDDDLYGPDRLWDYLRINLESAILASPDGHRWALGVDALGRCEALGGEALHLRLLKTVAIADLVKDRSRLPPSDELLKYAAYDCERRKIDGALEQLQRWSLIVFRKFSDAYSLFEGSDFDIEHAVEQASDSEVDFEALNSMAGLQPIVAKRHYHRTGALRWFDVRIVSLARSENEASDYRPRNGAIGAFFLAIPTRGESEDEAKAVCLRIARRSRDIAIVVGLSQHSWTIPALAIELSALERVRDESVELQDDRVGRLEVQARIAGLQAQLETELERAFDRASWFHGDAGARALRQADLNSLASDLAEDMFPCAPCLPNELLNRMKPSSSASAARNSLLKKMVQKEGEERLGIDGYPAELGLFASLLEATKLYRPNGNAWQFAPPPPENEDSHSLSLAWCAAESFLKAKHRAVSLSEIYSVWGRSPFGIKDGLLPVLAVAFILSRRKLFALYREGIFQPRLSELDIDYILGDPADIQLRWMALSETSRRLLSNMAEVVRELDSENALNNLEPIDVARGLVAIYDRLPPWVGRTQRLSPNAKEIRALLKKANDPNRLIFDDIPNVLNDRKNGSVERIASRVRKGLTELQKAFPAMLSRMREMLLAELEVPYASPEMLAELRARAENTLGLAGDHRLRAFIVRLSRFEGKDEDMESLASMAINKPPRDWVDPDIDRAVIAMAEMAQRFVRLEAFAHVNGRKDKRHAMAMVVGMEGRPATLHAEFDVTDLDRPGVESLLDRMTSTLRDSGEERRNVILAALSELSAQYLQTSGNRPMEPTLT